MNTHEPVPESSGKPGNWWQRNWKWFLPVGCLSMIALVIGFFTLIFVLAFGMLKSSDVCREAVARAETHAGVVELIGSPLKVGFLVSGRFNTSAGGSGSADMEIPVSGPDGRGAIRAVAERSAGHWTFSTLTFTSRDSGDQIDLLAP